MPGANQELRLIKGESETALMRFAASSFWEPVCTSRPWVEIQRCAGSTQRIEPDTSRTVDATHRFFGIGKDESWWNSTSGRSSPYGALQGILIGKPPGEKGLVESFAEDRLPSPVVCQADRTPQIHVAIPIIPPVKHRRYENTAVPYVAFTAFGQLPRVPLPERISI